jgi:pimeloyl-ACP methyl ester carboxylesterase
MSLEMRPFYFGSSDRPLFGIHHPPTGTSVRREAVVLCHPFGPEYVRAHRALRELCHRLSGAGFHALRFDYFGTGDSAGAAEEGTVEQWLTDVDCALLEAREASEGGRLSIVGLRFGATLAALAGARRTDVEKAVLWDPVVSGRGYVGELVERHRNLVRTRRWREDGPPPKAPAEVLGTPFPEALRAAIEAIDLLTLRRSPAARVAVITSDDDPPASALCDHLRRAGATAGYDLQPGTKVWLKQDEMEQALVPQATLGAIASWLSR